MKQAFISKPSKLIKTQPTNNQINPKVRKRLTELYYSMRGSESIPNKDLSNSEKPISTSVISSSPSPHKIPRILSYSPDHAISELPDRSDAFYFKLNQYYQQKHKSLLNKKKVELIDRFNKTQLLKKGRKNKSSKEKKEIPKVPSLFIRITDGLNNLNI